MQLSKIKDIVISRGYFGDKDLKRVGEEIEWTEDMVREWQRCSRDPKYFAQTYVKIITLDHGLTSFVPRGYQEEMLDSLHDNRFTIIATARQSGKTTTVVAFMLWYLLFHDQVTIALLANKGETSREILGRLKTAYRYLPKWLQQGIKEWNKGSIELENGSRIIAAATSTTAIRGYTINLLFIDECAHVENWEEFSTAVLPTTTSGTESKIVYVSTPNGLNHFYVTWTNAHKSGKEWNGFNPVKVTWDQVPGRDEKWRQETLAQLDFDEVKFSQEHEVEFMGSSGTLISGKKLKELVYLTPETDHNDTRIWTRPVKGRRYAVVADVSEGKGLDYSAASVVDVTSMPYDVVARYRSNQVTPGDYASVLNSLCRAYNDAALLVENKVVGKEVCSLLWNTFEYEGLLSTAASAGKGKKISSGFGDLNPEFGVNTSTAVKAAGCSLLKLLVEQNQLLIHDYDTIHELSTFSRKGKSYEAEPGKKDDMVMTLVLFAWLTSTEWFSEYSDISTVPNLRDWSEEQMRDQMLEIGFSDGQETEAEADVAALATADLAMGDHAWLLDDRYPEKLRERRRREEARLAARERDYWGDPIR